ncbi:hypothetical protein, partial [Actinotignum urinale]
HAAKSLDNRMFSPSKHISELALDCIECGHAFSIFILLTIQFNACRLPYENLERRTKMGKELV